MEQKNRILLPALGALLVAVLGGAVWAAIVVKTEYEIGLLAWAIGALAGYAVIRLNRYQATMALRVIAVIASLLGIFLGKYFAVAYYAYESLEGIFQSEVFSVFMENITEFFSAMDIVFIILAVITAWQMPARMQRSTAPADQTFSS